MSRESKAKGFVNTGSLLMPKGTHKGSELPMLTLKMVDGFQVTIEKGPERNGAP